MPYLELGTVFNAANFSLPFYFPSNRTAMLTSISVYQCPSDPKNQTIEEPSSPYPRYKGNYVVNWGNSHFWQNVNSNPFVGPYGTVTYLDAPFTANSTQSLSSLTDGSSNTLLMAEVIIPANNGNSSDHRGDIQNDDMNCAMFMAYTAPNSKRPDQVPSYCVYPYGMNPPCNKTSPAFNASRSWHSGGVNALFGDGSVHFVKSSINVYTWRGLSTCNGGEVISANSY